MNNCEKRIFLRNFKYFFMRIKDFLKNVDISIEFILNFMNILWMTMQIFLKYLND
jgi:hypothetical protein